MVDKSSFWRWTIDLTAIATIVGVIVTMVGYKEQLQQANEHMAVNLSRDLWKDFSDGELYEDIRTAIENCQKLYNEGKTGGSGEFNNDQINMYLDFFEDLGFYFKKKVLTPEIIDHKFGSYIIEAYEYEEIKQYIRGLRERAKQTEAYKDFELLAKRIENIPYREEETRKAIQACQNTK